MQMQEKFSYYFQSDMGCHVSSHDNFRYSVFGLSKQAIDQIYYFEMLIEWVAFIFFFF